MQNGPPLVPSENAPSPSAQSRSQGSYGGYGGQVSTFADLFDSPRRRNDIDWRDYVRAVRRRLWPALAVFLVVFITAVVHAFTRTPIYQAKARLVVETDRAQMAGLQDPLEQNRLTNANLQMQSTILQSRSLARRTMHALGILTDVDEPRQSGSVQNTAAKAPAPPGQFRAAALQARRLAAQFLESTGMGGFVRREESEADASGAEAAERAAVSAQIDGFLSRLTVAAVQPVSGLLDVSYVSPDPNAAARIVNTLVQQYIQLNLERKSLASKELTEWLAARLNDQRKALEASENALQRYRQENEAVAVQEQSAVIIGKLTELSEAYTKAKTDRLTKEALLTQAGATRKNEAALVDVPGIASDPVVQQLKTELATLQRQQVSLTKTFGERHPTLITAREATASTEERLRAQVVRVLSALRAEYDAARAAELKLGAALDAQKAESLSLNRRDIQQAVLERDAESTGQIYERLLQRVNEYGVINTRTSNIHVLDAGEPPLVPLSSPVQRDLRYGMFGGLLLALCVVFLLEHLDDAVKRPEEFADLELPFLGIVPLVGRGEEPTMPLVSDKPKSVFSEAMRSVRTNVRLSIAADGMRSVVVTSPNAGEGKTVLSTNLAMTLALAGQRVILVDADLRRPRLHKVFSVPQKPGLTNMLIGDGPASRIVYKTRTPQLHMCPSGPLPPNPSELLDSRRFRDFIAHLGEHYDWVILDAPPIMPVTDAVVLSNIATGVLIVAAAEVTPVPLLKAALEQLSRTTAVKMGGVLNKVDLERRRYYYANYIRQEYARYYAPSTPA